jgi:hypothetical protein
VRESPSLGLKYCSFSLTNSSESDILYLNLMGKHAIVLNSAKAAVDVLDRRGANYSDRPQFPFFDE